MRKIQKNVRSSPDLSALFGQEPLPYGAYQSPPKGILTNVWEGKKGWWSPRRWKRKAWVFYGVYTHELIAGIALVDAGYIAKAFCYAYHPATGYYYENEAQRLFGWSAGFDAEWDQPWELGPYRAARHNGQWELSYKGGFELSFRGQDNDQGLGFLCPSKGKGRPFHYTYKNMLLPTSVRLHSSRLGTRTWEDMPGAVDYSKGFPPRHTTWNWTSFMGRLYDGRPLAFNTVYGFNDDLENALWIEGEQYELGKVRYDYKAPLDTQPWKIKAEELELTLEPYGARQEKTNVGLLKSQFTQVYGKGEGLLFYQDNWLPYTGYGVMEEHEAHW